VDHKTLTTIINGHVLKFYPFAYSLIPDELQAQQLVIDAVAAYLVSIKDESFERLNLNSVPINILAFLYQLGMRRSCHIERSNLIDGDRATFFYSKPIIERAILYLKTHLKYSPSEISSIVGIPITDVVQQILKGKIDEFMLRI